MKLYNQYIEDVLSGKIVACKRIKQAVQRHLNDIERSKTDDYEYYFDEYYADHIISFVSICKLSGDEFQGTPFPIQPFQAWYYAMVYGWRHKKTKLRRFRRVYWSTARKSAKSEMTAPECIYHLYIEAKGAVQVVIAATTFDQGKYIYKPSEYMVRELQAISEDAAQTLKPQQYIIKNTKTGGYITRITAEAKKNDGAGVVFGVVDEYHAHPNDTVVGVISTSQGTNRQPILKIVTTAGFNKEGPDYAYRKYCYSVLDGAVKNERLFIGIFELDEDDDYHDPTTWLKPNPMYGITPTAEYMETTYNEAVDLGGEKLVEFLTKNLNQYTDSATNWISDDRYTSLANYRPLEELRGLDCYLGVDLASITDLTAVTAYFPKQNGLNKAYYNTMYFCPETKFEKVRVDGVVYQDFLKDGWVKKTDGNVIDKQQILDYITYIAQFANIKMIGYDPYKAVEIVVDLSNSGFETGQVRQGALSMSPAIDHWETQMLNNEIEHDGSPVTRWQMGNVEMKRDDNNNRRIVKASGKVEKKVDGPVSVVNAIVSYLDATKNEEKETSEDEMMAFLKATGQA